MLSANYRIFQSLQRFYSGGASAVSSDGAFILCACDGSLKIVNSSNPTINLTIEGGCEPVTAFTLKPWNNLYLYRRNRQIETWTINEKLSEFSHSWKGPKGPEMVMAGSPRRGFTATAGLDHRVRVWNHYGEVVNNFKGHKGVVTCIMFHPDPEHKLLFSGSDDTTVRVWYLLDNSCVATLENHQSTVTSIAISGRTMLTVGRDKVVNIWDLKDYTLKKTLVSDEALEAVCTFTAVSPFSKCLSSFAEKHNKQFSSSSVQFLTVGERGIVRIWNSEGNREDMILFEQDSSDLEGGEFKTGFTSAMVVDEEGFLYAVADHQFLVYGLDENVDGGLNLTLRKRLIGYNKEITDMKFVGDEEQYLAVAASVEQIRVYDVASMLCSYILSGHTDTVLCIDSCVSASGKSLIVSGSKDKTVRLWEPQSQRCVGVGIGHKQAVGGIAFSKKSRDFFVSSSSDGTLKVWRLDGVGGGVSNLEENAEVTAHSENINSIAVAPDDRFVCSGSQDHTAAIWKLPDLGPVVVLKGHTGGILSVEFSPVDNFVITASHDKTIKIWAIPDGSCLKTFEGHTSSVTRASFITRGTQTVSCGADGSVKLWRVETNECFATYDQHTDKIRALAIGKKTEMLATGGSDATINLWHHSASSEKEAAFEKEVNHLIIN